MLAQQEKKTKLSTPLNPSLYMYVVMSKHDNSLIMQSHDGTQYSCNTSHVKKLQQRKMNEVRQKRPVELKEPTQQDMEEQAEQEPDSPILSTPLRRSERHRVTPGYLKDYVT